MTVSSDLHRSPKSSIDALLLHKTDWRSIYFITSVAMMDSMRISTVLSNSWPYISSLDPEITENFNGLGVSVYTLGEDFVIQPFTNFLLHPMFPSHYCHYVPFTLLLLCSFHTTATMFPSLYTILFPSLYCSIHIMFPSLDCSFHTTFNPSHSSLTN